MEYCTHPRERSIQGNLPVVKEGKPSIAWQFGDIGGKQTSEGELGRKKKKEKTLTDKGHTNHLRLSYIINGQGTEVCTCAYQELGASTHSATEVELRQLCRRYLGLPTSMHATIRIRLPISYIPVSTTLRRDASPTTYARGSRESQRV